MNPTPEQRAEKILDAIAKGRPFNIAREIHKAVQAEREACAKVAENAALNFPVGCGHAQDIAAGIATAIRERSTT